MLSPENCTGRIFISSVLGLSLLVNLLGGNAYKCVRSKALPPLHNQRQAWRASGLCAGNPELAACPFWGPEMLRTHENAQPGLSSPWVARGTVFISFTHIVLLFIYYHLSKVNHSSFSQTQSLPRPPKPNICYPLTGKHSRTRRIA